MFAKRYFQALMIVAVVCIIGLAIFFEHYDHLLPCPLCVFQRVAYGLVALGAFVTFIGYDNTIAKVTGWVISLIFALAGLGMALRQVWLQHLGPQAMQACLPGLHYLYNTFSWFKATMLVFQGTSDCAAVNWRFLGLSMAAWSAILFGVFVLIFIINLSGHCKTTKAKA